MDLRNFGPVCSSFQHRLSITEIDDLHLVSMKPQRAGLLGPIMQQEYTYMTSKVVSKCFMHLSVGPGPREEAHMCDPYQEKTPKPGAWLLQNPCCEADLDCAGAILDPFSAIYYSFVNIVILVRVCLTMSPLVQLNSRSFRKKAVTDIIFHPHVLLTHTCACTIFLL